MELNGKEVNIVVPLSSNRSTTNYLEEEGYVYLKHGDVYAISLANKINEENDVSIKIDGKEVGVWRLSANSSGRIERSIDDRGCFTFYELGSSEAVQTDLVSVPKEELGLIQVTFIPEKVSRHPGVPAVDMDCSYRGSKGISEGFKGGERGGSTDLSFQSSRGGRGQSIDSGMRRGAGGTGLSGRSNQEFGRALPMELDYDRAVIISLRLVAIKLNEPKPLRAVSSVIANHVPPPVI
jgi:hypothetical protein